MRTQRKSGKLQLEVPPCDQLPGPDTCTFDGLGDYLTLMWWADVIAL